MAAKATPSTAFAPKRPGLDLALDFYHGNEGAVPGSAEAMATDDNVQEADGANGNDDNDANDEDDDNDSNDEDDDNSDDEDSDDSDDGPLVIDPERAQQIIDDMTESERGEYDAADEDGKESIMFIADMVREARTAAADENATSASNALAVEAGPSSQTNSLEDRIRALSATPAAGQSSPCTCEDDPSKKFPSAVVEEEWKSNSLTLRERAMLTLIDLITDKPDWNVKVHDETIVAKWKTEAQALPAEAVPSGFSDAMFDFTISELRDKAKIFEKYNGIVSVFDAAAVVIKQDVLTADPELHAALKAAIKPLEDVPDAKKDWHPGSDEKVLDIVHPSLWPLVYGKSRVLRDRTIGLEDALESVGAGEVIPVPKLQKPKGRQWGCPPTSRLFSTKFQWLPSEVELDGDKAKIASYINNLHPVEHAPVYSVVERLIEKALPLWDATYERVMSWEDANQDEGERTRIFCMDSGRECAVPEICKPDGSGYCDSSNRPGYNEDEDDDDDDNDDDMDEDDEWDQNERWYNETHPVKQPEPEEYKYVGPQEFKTSGPWFNGKKNLQVIVKFANIHLTPEKPSYDGGSWHIEGQLNERICATALFYYDNENVTDSHLSFRTQSDAEEMTCSFQYEQNDHQPFQLIYGVRPGLDDDSTVIEHGKVLTREGRLLVFPNVYQHRVGSFELADKTKAGHRKIVALFLVDPATPVISTANVPPQQLHWTDANASGGRLPPELMNIVYSQVGCPYSEDEAKKLREELIEERKALDQEADKAVQNGEWSFCEH